MKGRLSALGLLAVVAASPGLAQGSTTRLILTHVTLIDATGSKAKPDMSVAIRGHRIERVVPTVQLRVPGDAVVVDASGKFLIPGLWDMHVHTGQSDAYLPLYIANGVTGVRDMGGDLEQPTGYGSARYVELRLWRQAIGTAASWVRAWSWRAS